MNIIKTFIFGLVPLVLFGCATSKVQRPENLVDAQQPIQQEDYQGLKRKVAIARFSNQTESSRGAFYDVQRDPLGKQGLDILSTRLTASNKFILLERNDLDKIEEELKLVGNESSFQKVGADYLIIGAITEYGRKVVGEEGVFSRSKTQHVQAGVSIRLVDVYTGQVVYSEEAKGLAETTTSTVMGVGGTANYDATLSDKAISAAISKLVENIINNCTDRPWKSYILSNEGDAVIIAGGKSQGIKVGDIFEVLLRGKKITNPQTGMLMELPGTSVGKIQVLSMGGDDVQSEYSIVSFIQGNLDKGKELDQFIIQEIKK